MPNIYESGLSPLIELAKTALPGRRVVTAEDVARLLDPTTGAARRVQSGGLTMQVHPEEWKYLRGPDIIDALSEGRAERGRYTRDDVVDWMQNQPSQGSGPVIEWRNNGKGHESYTLPGPRSNYRVRGLEGADGLIDNGDYSYHFSDAPVHARLSSRGADPRSTHLDELQSDFYSMKPIPWQTEEQIRAVGEASARWSNAREAYNRAQDALALGRGSEADFLAARQVMNEAEGAYRNLPQIQDSGERPHGPFEKLWPRLAFNQVANEALDKGHDMVTWSPPWVHDRLYRGAEPAVSHLGMGDDGIGHSIRFTPETLRQNRGMLNLYRGPQANDFRRWADNPSGDFKLNSGQMWRDPASLMYHNTYGPRGLVEDSARRFLRAYGEDPAANLTTTRLEGAGFPAVSPQSRADLRTPDPSSADVPAMLITPRMRDIYKRLRDEGRPGVPLYSKGGSVSNASIEDHLLGRT